MIKNWFNKYKMLDDDEKEVYFQYVLDEEQQLLILDYERFKDAIRLLSIDTSKLEKELCGDLINVADEVALNFDDEGYRIGHTLLEHKCIERDIYNKVVHINELLASIDNEDVNWTTHAMNNDERWLKARELAKQLIIRL